MPTEEKTSSGRSLPWKHQPWNQRKRRSRDFPLLAMTLPLRRDTHAYDKETSEMSIETINRSCMGSRFESRIYALRFVASVTPDTVTGSKTYCAAAKPPEAST